MRFIFVVLITLIYASVPAFADYSGPFSPTGPLAFTPATIVNPTDPAYGAKCDGATDDTSALQAWVNAVIATGAKGELPVGTCLTTGLTIDVSSSGKGILIEGQGDGQSVIKQKSGSTNPVITYIGVAGYGNQPKTIFHNFTIYGTGTGSHGIYMPDNLSASYAQGIDIDHITITFPGKDCIYAGINNGNGIVTSVSCSHPGRNGLTNFSPDWKFEHSYFGGADQAGIQITGASSDGGVVRLTATNHGLPANPVFTGSISTTTLTVSAVTSGTIAPGYEIVGGTTAANTVITQQLTGSTGSTGTYQVSVSQTVTSTLLTGYPQVMSYDVQGATGTVGQFYASVIDANHVDLLNSTFGGSYTCCGRLVPIWSIINITSDGGLIQITTNIPHNLATGAQVLVRCGSCGVPNSDGMYFITVTGANTFDLPNTTFSGSFIPGTGATARSGTTGIMTIGPNQFVDDNVFSGLINVSLNRCSGNGSSFTDGEYNGAWMGGITIQSCGVIQPDVFKGILLTGNSGIGDALYPDIYLSNTGGEVILANNFYYTPPNHSSYLVYSDPAVTAPILFQPSENAVDQASIHKPFGILVSNPNSNTTIPSQRYAWAFGQSCLAGGSDSVCMGYNNTVSGQGSIAAGNGGNDNAERSFVFGGSVYANSGDNQLRLSVLSAQSTSTTPVTLTTDRAVASSSNCLNVHFNYQKYFIPVLEISASIPTTTDWAYWKVTDLVLNMGNGVATTAISAANGSTSPSLTSLAPTASSSGLSTARVSLSADGTNGCLTISATGIAATTIDWNAAPIDGELR